MIVREGIHIVEKPPAVGPPRIVLVVRCGVKGTDMGRHADQNILLAERSPSREMD